MPLYFSPVGNDQTFDANGDPLTGGQIETYINGSSTPLATFTDDTGSTPQSNPIILNSLGYPTLGPIWLTGGQSYKFVIKDSLGATLRTIDNISGVNDASLSQSEWVVSGFTPTYINATSFSVPGDQTMVLQVNRRLRTTNTSGFIYSTISNSVFAAGITTVTVVNDSGVLDAGLSVVECGLLAAAPSSIPSLPALTGVLSIAQGGTGATTASTAFDALKQAATETATGVVEIATQTEFNTGTDTSRVPPVSVLRENGIVLIPLVTLTNQTSVDFSNIPSWVKKINVIFSGVSTNGTSIPLIMLGDSGGVENTGYQGSVSTVSGAGSSSSNLNNGFSLCQAVAAATTIYGHLTLVRMDSAGTTWAAAGVLGNSNVAATNVIGGVKSLSGALTSVRLVATNGTDQFDAGAITVSYE